VADTGQWIMGAGSTNLLAIGREEFAAPGSIIPYNGFDILLDFSTNTQVLELFIALLPSPRPMQERKHWNLQYV
tara:strand:+ start:516 stop:737 length:222 start_codon:yes stop_codon:yes gene_type:complete